jgi:hypothetical protein
MAKRQKQIVILSRSIRINGNSYIAHIEYTQYRWRRGKPRLRAVAVGRFVTVIATSEIPVRF